jgi:thioredoxin-like negative regulator of GroEL
MNAKRLNRELRRLRNDGHSAMSALFAMFRGGSTAPPSRDKRQLGSYFDLSEAEQEARANEARRRFMDSLEGLNSGETPPAPPRCAR